MTWWNDRVKFVLAYSAISIIWGSTFLVTKLTFAYIPPVGVAGLRATVAGTILLLWAKSRGRGGATWRQWGAATLCGCLMFLMGHGLLCWAMAYIDSGHAALIDASLPLWITFFAWSFGVTAVSRWTWLVLALGMVGVGITLGNEAAGMHSPPVLVWPALILGCVGWAIGTIYAPRAGLPDNAAQRTGMQLIGGGIPLLLANHLVGGRLSLEILEQPGALMGLGYLVLFGSLIGFSSYQWLIRHCNPVIVGTYALVNPLVAVLLGTLVGGEQLSVRALIGGSLILTVVALLFLTTANTAPRKPEKRALTPSMDG